jgi:hypothetical protein
MIEAVIQSKMAFSWALPPKPLFGEKCNLKWLRYAFLIMAFLEYEACETRIKQRSKNTDFHMYQLTDLIKTSKKKLHETRAWWPEIVRGGQSGMGLSEIVTGARKYDLRR